MLIKEDIIYVRRNDLEDDITSTIWIEIKLPNSKPTLIASIYRQWSLPNILNIKNSHTTQNQTTRWQQIIDRWQQAPNEKKEIIVTWITTT